ncbi:cysteine desulfurase [Halobacillus fulvus]|nr:cysteine desulfurase [Halobacillus fulvus]
MIYLDNSATTHPHAEVLKSYQKVADVYFANPSSVHKFGSEAERLLQQSRKQAAQLLHVSPNEVVFTSGGTEGNNMAIKGIALMHQNRGKHLITSKVEHPSVIEAFRALESLGFDVTYLPVDRSGKVDPAHVSDAVRNDTILVSIMSVNNELGTKQPIRAISDIVKEFPKVFLHVDHVQGFGKVDVPIGQIDLCTISGHKIHGVKGTGALIVKNHVSLFPLLHGGGQESSVRGGTENLPGIVALVKAMRLMKEEQSRHHDRLERLRDMLWERLSSYDDILINSPTEGAPHILNFSVPGFKPEVIIHALGERNIFISTKSACSSKEPDVSSVLQACNLDYSRTNSALRVSLSYENTEEELKVFLEALKESIQQLQATMGR